MIDTQNGVQSGIPREHIWVGSASARCPRRADIICGIGREISFDADVFAAYRFREISPVIHDLFLLAAAVAFTDKVVTRRAATSWRRQLTITLPVHDPSMWSDANVERKLVDLLGLLTGDAWRFRFNPREEDFLPTSQSILPLGEGTISVIPYSDGLDSFAAARLAAHENSDQSLILVTTGRQKVADQEWRFQTPNGNRRRISVPFRLSDLSCKRKFREQSYRSRGFVYGLVAGVTAYLSEAEKVIIPECGQGSICLPLVPIGPEVPDIRTHPMFTMKLAEFLSAALEHPIRFEHSRIWHTKGETLSALVAAGIADGWDRTRSCSRDSRHIYLDRRTIQCGVCATCLLRRQSVSAAGMSEPEGTYLWSDLSASTLDLAAMPGARKAKPNDEEQAKCGAFLLDQMARLASAPNLDQVVDQAAFELSGILDAPKDDVELRLRRLIVTHSREWTSFIKSVGPRSFLFEWLSAAA